jgi:hypothetical protein
MIKINDECMPLTADAKVAADARFSRPPRASSAHRRIWTIGMPVSRRLRSTPGQAPPQRQGPVEPLTSAG